MSIHSAFPAGVLITNGLGAEACGPLITAAKFHLFGCDLAIVIPPAPATSSGGGHYPLAPGEIGKFYAPVDKVPDFYTPVDIDPTKPPKQLVIVRLTINDKLHEKEFLLKEKPYKALIKIINLENATIKQIKIAINNLRIKLHDIVIRIKNLRKK
jgi:hypothetical protein